jgi:hypothetical protein
MPVDSILAPTVTPASRRAKHLAFRSSFRVSVLSPFTVAISTFDQRLNHQILASRKRVSRAIAFHPAKTYHGMSGVKGVKSSWAQACQGWAAVRGCGCIGSPLSGYMRPSANTLHQCEQPQNDMEKVGPAGLILGPDLRVEPDRSIKARYLARSALSPPDLLFRFADSSVSHRGEAAEKSCGRGWRELWPPPQQSSPAFPRCSRILL